MPQLRCRDRGSPTTTGVVETLTLVKNFLLGFLTGLVIAILAALGYLRAGLADVRADEPVPQWQAALMSASIHASVRRSAPKAENPLPPGDARLVAGGKLYLNDCVGCHGEPGKPPSDFGATFYPPVPQFPTAGTKYSEAEIFWVAKHGIRRTGMSAQGFTYGDRDLWALASFISRISNLPPNVMDELHRKPEAPAAEAPK
jgi:mono/diheme cytochrome c family protein